MSSYVIFLIIAFILIRNSTRKSAQRRAQSQNREREIYTESTSSPNTRRQPGKDNTITKRLREAESASRTQKAPVSPAAPEMTNMADTKTVKTQKTEANLTDIEKRRIEKHESHMDKRIHRNVHADDFRWEEEDNVAFMEHVRDLIVCGYPTELPNQRDFVKEGEDFLAGLGGDSLFF